MSLAALDPQWAPIIAAFAALATALGWSERRRRQGRKENGADVDRRAAETILTQWQAVLDAAQVRARWAEQQERLCEERNEVLEKRLDDLTEKVRVLGRRRVQ